MHAPAGRGFQGSVLFTRSDIEDKSKCLVIGIGGDTLMSIVAHLTGRQSERPMSLNLMWNIIQKGEKPPVNTADLKALTLLGLLTTYSERAQQRVMGAAADGSSRPQ